MSNQASTWRQRLKPYARTIGLTSSNTAWHAIALAAYRRKRAQNSSYREWLAGPDGRRVADHWGTLKITDAVTWEHTASQLFELTALLKARMGSIGHQSLVLDAGASDGSFLSILGIRRGVGVNFLNVCARKIRADGYPSVRANIERLPFVDRSVEHVIFLETLEHAQNPILALNELARVCRGTIYLSIPWLSRTRVNGRPEGWPEVESHIFEFCEEDFRKIVTHVKLTIAFSTIVQVFPEPPNPLARWWLTQWMYPSYFPRLQYYELCPIGEGTGRADQR